VIDATYFPATFSGGPIKDIRKNETNQLPFHTVYTALLATKMVQ
jgi:hypothetical protein